MSTKNNSKNKTNRLRQWRREFRQKFGETTVQVVSRLARGQDTATVAKATKVPRTSVTTYRGNLNRDFYYPYVHTVLEGSTVDGYTGRCQF